MLEDLYVSLEINPMVEPFCRTKSLFENSKMYLSSVHHSHGHVLVPPSPRGQSPPSSVPCGWIISMTGSIRVLVPSLSGWVQPVRSVNGKQEERTSGCLSFPSLSSLPGWGSHNGWFPPSSWGAAHFRGSSSHTDHHQCFLPLPFTHLEVATISHGCWPLHATPCLTLL